MQILNYNAQVGDCFENFCKEVRKFALSCLDKNCSNQVFPDEVYTNVFDSLPESEQEEYELPDWEENWEAYSNAKKVFGSFYLLTFLKSCKENSFEIHSNFNGRKIVVLVGRITQTVTTLKEMQEQWEQEGQRLEEKRNQWLLTPEGIEYTKKQKTQELEWKQKEKDFQETLKIASFSFSEGGEEKWNKTVEVNSDGYGKGVVDYAKVWAYLMEKEIEKLNHLTLIHEVPTLVLSKEIMDSTSSEADGEGITGFMYGAAVSILADCWKYGEQLRKIHNKNYGVESEGVVNPAVLTVSV